MNAPAIEIVCCGGTIDKIYFDAESSYQVGEPAATAIVARARIHRPPRIVSLLRKDSLEMDDDDRARLAAHLLASTGAAFRRRSRHRHDGGKRALFGGGGVGGGGQNGGFGGGVCARDFPRNRRRF